MNKSLWKFWILTIIWITNLVSNLVAINFFFPMSYLKVFKPKEKLKEWQLTFTIVNICFISLQYNTYTTQTFFFFWAEHFSKLSCSYYDIYFIPKYFSVYLLRTRTLSYIITTPLPHSRTLTLTKYNNTQLYPNVSNSPKDVFYRCCRIQKF